VRYEEMVQGLNFYEKYLTEILGKYYAMSVRVELFVVLHASSAAPLSSEVACFRYRLAHKPGSAKRPHFDIPFMDRE
jgi:hypothetical protein